MMNSVVFSVLLLPHGLFLLLFWKRSVEQTYLILMMMVMVMELVHVKMTMMSWDDNLYF